MVNFCKHFPPFCTFSLISTDYHVYNVRTGIAPSCGSVPTTCAFLAYMDAHQKENVYKNELYTPLWATIQNNPKWWISNNTWISIDHQLFAIISLVNKYLIIVFLIQRVSKSKHSKPNTLQ